MQHVFNMAIYLSLMYVIGCQWISISYMDTILGYCIMSNDA